MHFEVLVEDLSGSILLDAVLPKILSGDDGATYRLHPYKGIGRLPKGLKPKTHARKRVLLDQLPRLLGGYGRSQVGQPAAVVVVMDLDDADCMELEQALEQRLAACQPRPTALFRIAIEEMEAWLLGDRAAVEQAYPGANGKVLDHYVQDSICGTWETLAEAIYPGGLKPLKKQGYPKIGEVKCEWAKRIAPLLDVAGNASKSFQVFRDGVRRLASATS